MPIPSRLLAALVTSALTAALTAGGASAARAQDTSRQDTVGGEQLAARGVVVDDSAPALPQVAAAGWLVGDLDTGEVLAARDPHGRYAPASTLKALTAVTLIPELPADRVVRASFDDVAVEGSRVGVVEHVDYTVGELFSALLMVSGNDAANVLASTAGGQTRTAELMNAKAASLGALDTHAVNPHGLDAPGQVSSPYDLALIARAGLDDPDFSRYVSTISSSVNAPGGTRIEIRNKNKLLGRYPGALGVKNGFTTAARASFIGAAERDGRRLVVTLMRSDPRVFDEAVKLLDWGFSAAAAEPVGELVTPEQDRAAAEQTAERERASLSGSGPDTSGSALSGTTTAAGTAPRPTDEGTGVTVTLAGLGLAAAALLAVRVRPASAGTSAARRGARPAPRSARSGTARAPSRTGRTSAERAPAQRRPVERRRAPR